MDLLDPQTPPRVLSSEASDGEKFSYDDLPVEVLTKILQYLPDCEKVKCELVSKRWFQVLKSFWQDKTGLSFKVTWNCNIDVFRDDKLVKSIVSGTSKFEIAFTYCIRQACLNLQKISIDDVPFKDATLFFYMIENCKNLNSLVLNNLSFENLGCFNSSQGLFGQLFTLENLSQLVIKSCAINDFAVENFNNESFKCRLSHLQLQNVGKRFCAVQNKLVNQPFTEASFIPLCQFVGSSLENFCFKYNDIDLEIFSKGFQFLKHLKHLNLSDYEYVYETNVEKSDHSLHLDDAFLLNLASSCSNLETLNLKGNTRISSLGVNQLIEKCVNLSLLNLELCRLVDDGLLEKLKNRSTDGLELVIFAKSTSVTSSLVNRSVEGCKWRVVVETECDEMEFYGEEKKPNDDDDSKNGSVSGDGYNSDDHEDYDFDNDMDDYYEPGDIFSSDDSDYNPFHYFFA